MGRRETESEFGKRREVGLERKAGEGEEDEGAERVGKRHGRGREGPRERDGYRGSLGANYLLLY